MSIPKYTKKQFDNLFPTDEICLDFVFKKLYKNTGNCPKCAKPFKYYKLKTYKLYSCQYCGHNISPLANTIFYKSSTSLKDWFYAIYLFSVSKNGISAKELERQLGVTYKTAWRMAHHIRKLCSTDSGLLSGIVEIDETYVGGKESNKHKDKKTPDNQGRSLKTKSAVLGAVQREGNIVAKIVVNTQSSIIKPFIRENICITAQVKTDEYGVNCPSPLKGTLRNSSSVHLYRFLFPIIHNIINQDLTSDQFIQATKTDIRRIFVKFIFPM